MEDVFILLTNKYMELDSPRANDPYNQFSMTKEEQEEKALEEATKIINRRAGQV